MATQDPSPTAPQQNFLGRLGQAPEEGKEQNGYGRESPAELLCGSILCLLELTGNRKEETTRSPGGLGHEAVTQKTSRLGLFLSPKGHSQNQFPL